MKDPLHRIHRNYPSSDHLRERARQRLPAFAFEYLDGGCFSCVNLARNTDEIREVLLRPQYLCDHPGSSLKTELFGHVYDAPFGVAPVGLQGLIWPGSCEYLAQAAFEHNLPFVLSTVGTASIERVAELTEGRAWFQLYHPAHDSLRDKLVARAADAGLGVLVLLADTPAFAYRPKEIKNGLSIPPRMSARNVLQMLAHPAWCLGQLATGKPTFATMLPYLPEKSGLTHLSQFMHKNFSGRLSPKRIAALRELWKGKLVIKGIVTEEDADLALDLGADGLIVSNHGGRQLDAGESTIKALARLAPKFASRTTLMLDSGLRSGSDIACALATGAHSTFLGRTFMYGAAALGRAGGDHTMAMLKEQLQQVLEQLGCKQISDLPAHLAKDTEYRSAPG
ncbi:MAG: alpha-hydroxy acid oxidase [bacterium]|jgi:L-lactate dehydrogenase (cytochrome)|nr:alpha-hydroxy-acid oxidizing protein [Planctomycetota bacterium]HIL50985.1 alpha-hydroxy-acid oxidizing protein [Planctomycetota bacterium]